MTETPAPRRRWIVLSMAVLGWFGAMLWVIYQPSALRENSDLSLANSSNADELLDFQMQFANRDLEPANQFQFKENLFDVKQVNVPVVIGYTFSPVELYTGTEPFIPDLPPDAETHAYLVGRIPNGNLNDKVVVQSIEHRPDGRTINVTYLRCNTSFRPTGSSVTLFKLRLRDGDEKVRVHFDQRLLVDWENRGPLKQYRLRDMELQKVEGEWTYRVF